jgi:hypothetical protein
MPFGQVTRVVGKIVGFSVESGIYFGKIGYSKVNIFTELYTQDVEQLFVWESGGQPGYCRTAIPRVRC